MKSNCQTLLLEFKDQQTKGTKMFQDSAACNPESQDLWFSELASKVAKAKAICATCSVMNKCLQFAIDSDIEYGIFGGKTPTERKELVNG